MITIKTFDSFSLNSASYKAIATSTKSPPPAQPIFVDQMNADQMYSGAYKIDVRSVVVTVRLLTTVNRAVLESQLKEACRPGKTGLLVGTFDDDGEDYQLNVVVQSIVIGKNGLWTIIFSTGETTWRKVTADTDSWAVSASGATKDITVGGYSPTRLNVSITPTGLPATGYAYQRLYQLVNKAGYGYGLRPWCITLDTAALVTAGKMQADGDDIVVVVDGVVAKRWLGGMNTSATNIWFNINLAAGQTLVLLTPVASSGAITELVFAKTTNTKAALNALPSRGYVQHETEWFEYTGKDVANYKLTGVTRAALGTAMQAHSAADSFAWIEHSIFLLYGNSAATAPALTDSLYDATKPVFDLVNSTNASWVYTATTKFHDASAPDRTGGWTPVITKVGNESDVFEEADEAEGGAPAMGMRLSTWYRNGVVKGEKATLAWQFNHPGGISAVSMTGKKYRNTSLWPATAAAQLERSLNAKTWLSVWSEAIPTAEDTWESFTHNAAAITSNMANVRFSLAGTFAAQANTDAWFEVLTCTLAFYATNEPTGTLGSEVANYLLDVTIKNTTTGDQVTMVFPMLLNTALVLDAEEFSVEYGGVNAAACLALDDNSRAIWIRLEPETVNALVLTGTNVGTLTVALSWFERRM